MRINWQIFIKVAIASLLFGFIQFVQAGSMIATLPDGREVILLEDNTWRFVTPQIESSSPDQASAATIPSTGNVAKGTATGAAVVTGTAITSGKATAPAVPSSGAANAPTKMASSAKGDLVAPDTGRLVGEYQRSGVVMVAQSASYQDGRLTIPVSLRNEGTDSVILVEVATILRNDSGEVLKRDNHVVWTSIKRMPETYFRPGTEKEGKILTFTVPKLEHYFLETDITTVERW
ncbi:hypothetical protein C9J01_19375 [Photobacterium rosenbergii]|uniref:DUF3157 domain-containing protein n=1 Tax=Photobacterium rosenbergii TaxID=294936 RepID=A0A2T3N9C8_9GAMM|nr:DUF3157 family protein [Photobacterium rosenbergii]PSW10021.1 hypothetical protein C9J01_19375 [Photobacterium rosenbergii]